MTGTPRCVACSSADSIWAEPAGETTSAFTPVRVWSSRIVTCWSMLISRSGAHDGQLHARTRGRRRLAPVRHRRARTRCPWPLVTSAISISFGCRSVPRLPGDRSSARSQRARTRPSPPPPTRSSPSCPSSPCADAARRSRPRPRSRTPITIICQNARDVEQVEAVAQEPDDQRADQRAAHRAHARRRSSRRR